jgi:hypothetical protein
MEDRRLPGRLITYMSDPLRIEAELVAALKLTAAPPRAWIDAAALLPSTLGDLAEIEQVVVSPEFRRRFAADPHAAVAGVGLSPSEPLVRALQARLA